MNRSLLLGLGFATLTLAASASAQTFDMSWKNSFTGDSNVVLTTTSLGGGEYKITNATGTIANFGAVSGVQDGLDGADDILYMNNGKQFASFGGITFNVPSDYINVFSNGGKVWEQNSAQQALGNTNGTELRCLKVTQAVPEPSSYAVLGVGAIGLILRRRKK